MPTQLRRDETLQRLTQMMPELRLRFDVRTMSIFGSVARDEATEQSDLDVLVDFESAPTFMNFMGLQDYLEEVFATRVDLVTEAALRDRLRARIEAEAMRVA